MNERRLIISALFLAAVLLGIWVLIMLGTFSGGSRSAIPLSFFPGGTPISVPPVPALPATTTPGAPTRTVMLANGSAMAVKDFLKDPNVIPDVSNAGHYFLTGAPQFEYGTSTVPSETRTSYVIFYTEKDSIFHIILEAEPLGKVREGAEQFLMQKLGLSQAEMCRLVYWVGTPSEVNSFYSGLNLGFSFCSGATQLAQ